MWNTCRRDSSTLSKCTHPNMYMLQRFRCVQSAAESRQPFGSNKLSNTIRRKQQQIQQLLTELGEEVLEERLQSAGEMPVSKDHSYRLARCIEANMSKGQMVLVLELSRTTSVNTSEQLAQLGARYVAAGADALAVRIDADYTPEGTKDLWSVCRAAKAPVLAWDWFLHPLQVVEVKEAGAAGVVGAVASVLSKGTPIMSSFAASLGLDCPVEVVNASELREVSQFGVPFYGVNLSVGLSVGIAGFGSQVAKGLVGELPFGAISMVGVRSLDEARAAKMAGADSLLVKAELVEEYKGRLPQLVEQLRYLTSLDD